MRRRSRPVDAKRVARRAAYQGCRDRRGLKRVVWGFLLAALNSPEADGHVGTEVYPIYKVAPGAIDLHDGSLADWEDITAGESIPIYAFVDRVRGRDFQSIDPEDFAFRVFLGWSQDEQRIYVAVEAFDDVVTPPGQPGDTRGDRWKWTGDCVQFYVDGDHTGGVFNLNDPDYIDGEYEFFEPEGWPVTTKEWVTATAQQYNLVPESPDDRRVFVANGGNAWVGDAPWSEGGGKVHSYDQGIWVVESAVTAWDHLDWRGSGTSRRSELFAGKVIGVHMVVQDIDPPDGPGFYVLGGFIDAWFDADLMADAVLCGDQSCLPGSVPGKPSAVRTDTWGRIKASFR